MTSGPGTDLYDKNLEADAHFGGFHRFLLSFMAKNQNGVLAFHHTVFEHSDVVFKYAF